MMVLCTYTYDRSNFGKNNLWEVYIIFSNFYFDQQ